MRKSYRNIAFVVTVCSLTLLIALYSYSRTVNNAICSATEEQVEKIKPLDGKMLWESLSSQFVSSLHQ